MLIKKAILNLILVAFVVFVLDFVIGRTLRYYYFKQTSGQDFRTTIAMDSTKAEVLVFGSSSANHHYVPEIFEKSLHTSFYNTGRDGNGIFYQTAVLESVVRRYIPKIIILDFRDSFEREEDAYSSLSSLLPYYKTHEEIKNIVELKSPFERIKLLSEVYPFNSKILTIGIGNTEINKKRNFDHDGYVALYSKWQHKIVSVGTPAPYVADSNKLKALPEFIRIAKRSGAKVYVIYSPVFLKFDRMQEIDVCKAICEFEKVTFWNFSQDSIFLNNSQYFQDPGHLNQIGAILFSNFVVEKIKLDKNTLY